MKKILLLLALGCLMCVTGCRRGTPGGEVASSDSLYTFKEIVRVHIENPDLALARVDTAEMRGVVSEDSCVFLRIIINSAMGNYKESEGLAKGFLSRTKMDKRDAFYLGILSSLSDDYKAEGRYEESLEVCKEGIKLAHEAENGKREADFNYTAGNCMIYLGNDRGYDYIDSAIALLERSDNEKDIPWLSTYIGQKSRMLANAGRFAEAAEACGERLKVIERMKDMQGVPDGYLDEQRGLTLSVKAYCLAREGRAGEAEAAAGEFYGTAYAQTPKGCGDIQNYELVMRHGARLLDLCGRQHASLLKMDTVTAFYASHLDVMAQAYRMLGRFAEADAMMVRKDVVNDSLMCRERESKAIEMSEQYHTQEKELALMNEQARLKVNRMVLMALAVVLVLVSVLAWVIYSYYKKTKCKNRVLVKRINELMDCQKEIRLIKQQQAEVAIEGTTGPVAAEEDGTTGAVPGADVEHHEETIELNLGKEQNVLKCNLGLSALFAKLEGLMQNEKIFKDAAMNRDTIMQLLNINRNQLAQMMAENANGMSISTYINEYRVRNACEMIRENPEVSMQMVCTECGFSSIRTFNRLFKQQISMTPIEYKMAL